MTNDSMRYPFDDLGTAQLVLGATYEGARNGNSVGNEPINRLMGCGNMGGFRFTGTLDPFRVRQCILFSLLAHPDWPDTIDEAHNRLTYYGDNRRHGQDLHETPAGGNLVLREVFERLHLNRREHIPPFFLFAKGAAGRDVTFRGLAVPGARGMTEEEDLIAFWRTSRGTRTLNYRATFTLLDVPVIERAWLESIRDDGQPIERNAPGAWLAWRFAG